MENLIELSLLLIIVPSVFAIKCNFPPELWCSSPEIAEACDVQRQCIVQQKAANNDHRVNFALYYESYCFACQDFINGQLHKAYTAVGEIMDLTLVPYGNAEETKSGSKWVFKCQHGKQECQGNILETCILHYAPSVRIAFSTIYCMEVSQDPVSHSQQCINENKLDYSQIMECANGSLGNALEHQMALKTDALNPPHTYVPWVTLNGVHNKEIQNAARKDLKGLICKTYQGPKPPACSSGDKYLPRPCVKK